MNTARGLIPMYDEDYEDKKKLKIGQVYRAKVTVPRNIGLHRKYFSLVRCAWDMLTPELRAEYGEGKTDNEHAIEDFRRDIQMDAGYYDIMYCHGIDRKIKVPKSISYNNLSGEGFETLYRRVREVLFEKYLAHITMEQFEEQLLNY